PGAIRTPINRPAWETPEAYNDLLRLIPYKRIGEPEDIARLAVWLSSDEADYITGASLFVDGGMTLYPGFATGGGAASPAPEHQSRGGETFPFLPRDPEDPPTPPPRHCSPPARGPHRPTANPGEDRPA